ncbi:hypothetical protein CMO92_01080 [Candidatus Woesearchaeota archaeon]|nr:hypothetical protein [Candidatus Woesearchaeota archaeon]|tara:strand:+ start:419 stop:715 length:297 start_codon:yes stop_codon:yes gene_type:complete
MSEIHCSDEDDIYDDSIEKEEDELYDDYPEYEDDKKKKIDPIEKAYKEEEVVKSKTDSYKEMELDEVTGGRDKKPVLSILNQRRVNKYEMDEIFCQDE